MSRSGDRRGHRHRSAPLAHIMRGGPPGAGRASLVRLVAWSCPVLRLFLGVYRDDPPRWVGLDAKRENMLGRAVGVLSEQR